jgi:hypothetical protein
MIITVEHDGRFGPVEKKGSRELYEEDLSMLPLALA